MIVPGSPNTALMAGSVQYRIGRSLRFRGASVAYLSRPLSGAGVKAWTISCWLKRGSIGTGILQNIFGTASDTSNFLTLGFHTNDALRLVGVTGGTGIVDCISNALFRDPSAHLHVIVAVDTTQAVAANRLVMTVNGQPLVYTGTAPVLNSDLLGPWTSRNIGRSPLVGNYYDGLMAEFCYVAGQAVSASAFGEVDKITGAWVPKRYAGVFGADGFYLNFSDNSASTAAAIGKDLSGNGNDWTPAGISVAAGATNDSLIDTPTNYDDGGNGRGNYPVLNPVWGLSTGFSNGNLRHTVTGTNTGVATMGMTSGKWYCELLIETVGTSAMVGLVSNTDVGNSYPGVASDSYGYYTNGNKYNANSAVAYGTSYTSGDVIGIAYDADAGKLWFSKNNTWQAAGVPSSGTLPAFTVSDFSKTWFFATGAAATGTIISANFGQQPFVYSPPAGFSSLNTQNLLSPSIPNPVKYMDATSYSGTGVPRSVANAGTFSPDLVWGKSRSAGSSNILADSVRGATTYSISNNAGAEGVDATLYSAFNVDGFSIGTNTALNTNGAANVAWQWKKGVIPGFDIVAYTGNDAARSINHSLGAVPAMKIVKQRTGTRDWYVSHRGIAATGYLLLDAADGAAVNAAVFSGSDTSSVFNLGANSAVNGGGVGYIAYLWAEVAGFSRIGSYIGNGSSSGPFIHCGFRPKYVVIKRSDAGGSNWCIYDAARSPSNPALNLLFADAPDAETTASNQYPVDFLSNGFKVRASSGATNTAAATFIYMAFAENPFKYARAR